MAKEGSGLILGLVVGIAGLVISVIIAFILISTVADVENDLPILLAGYTVTNETENAAGQMASLNDTTYLLGQAAQTGFAAPIIIELWNITTADAHVIINTGNASVTGAGVLTNGTTLSGGWYNVSVSYSYSREQSTITTTDLRGNFTAGIDKVSSKIPTILLIAAVVLILGILALLWQQYQKMNIGGSGSL